MYHALDILDIPPIFFPLIWSSHLLPHHTDGYTWCLTRHVTTPSVSSIFSDCSSHIVTHSEDYPPSSTYELTDTNDCLSSLWLTGKRGFAIPPTKRTEPISLSWASSHRWLWLRWDWTHNFLTVEWMLFCSSTQDWFQLFKEISQISHL